MNEKFQTLYHLDQNKTVDQCFRAFEGVFFLQTVCTSASFEVWHKEI
jgi:hypothetical protein